MDKAESGRHEMGRTGEGRVERNTHADLKRTQEIRALRPSPNKEGSKEARQLRKQPVSERRKEAHDQGWYNSKETERELQLRTSKERAELARQRSREKAKWFLKRDEEEMKKLCKKTNTNET